ncbi:hypothetical protein F4775DRAFT_603144 [Biscogniauxia sp. FL1348]|nr:hypothetical protein F4775DRAFT_603144 [Biscogniauxia sp. FL1348]
MAYKEPSSEPIAVVGSGCRFPGGATSPSKLWDVLCEAPDLSREVPSGRFNAKAFYHEDGEHHGTTDSTKAYWLDQDHRVFDAGFFHISPMEAEAMDPQQRLLLEVVYEAIESAGFTLRQYSGKDVGVWAGVMTQDYDTLSQRDELETSPWYATSNARSIISNRISYFFDFKGPSMTIDTACSSSLVALHQAVLSLRSREISMACVTGVNLMITPEQFLVESSLHMLSPTGKSRMWDAGADGYARGEGVAALLLKPLSQALADGDRVEAIIRETGVNSDGRTRGITMPNPKAQADLIKSTYQRSGLNPFDPEDRCQYFEAHGTGTQAGDPREAEAINEAFFGIDLQHNGNQSEGRNMLVGSIKTILGHAEGAAGLAGLLKVIQAMKNGCVPPNLHLNSLNPKVKPFYTHLEIPISQQPWPEPPRGQPRRASVNSFGFGGTNAHAIVESYVPHIHNVSRALPRSLPLPETRIQPSAMHISRGETGQHGPLFLPLAFSAASQKSLRAVIGAYKVYLEQHQDVSLPQLSWHLICRDAMSHRVTVSASSTSRAIEALDSLLHGATSLDTTGTRSKTMPTRPRILGIFTGQGAQWPTMSKALFQTNRVYRETIRRLDKVLKGCREPPKWKIEEHLMAKKQSSQIHEAAISQPVCTAVQIGLVDVVKSLGFSFHTVIGHSSGEIAAAYAAGKLSARDAILISYHRGRFAHLAGGPDGQKGGMLAAGISESEAFDFCKDEAFAGRIFVAASNAPSSVTLSGDMETIRLARTKLVAEGKFAKKLFVDTAYHSPHMYKPAYEYTKALQESGISPSPEGNGSQWISSVRGYSMTDEKDLGGKYWKDNMVQAVQFYDAVKLALTEHGPYDYAVEIGPHAALKGPVGQAAKAHGSDLPYSGLLDRAKNDTLAFADFLSFLWLNDSQIETVFRNYVGQSGVSNLGQPWLVDQPQYPWDHSQVHWRESRISRQFHHKTAAPHELLGVRTRDDNEHQLRWRNILKLDRIPWLEHHSFQGQALLPASGYCVMALDAIRSLLAGRTASLVEIKDLQLTSGITIDRESPGMEVLFSLTITRSGDSFFDAYFTVTSCPANGTTTMKKNATGSIKMFIEDSATDVLPLRQPCESEMLSASPDAFYKMMDETGLVYSGPYRALSTIQRRLDYCSATLRRRHPEDTTVLPISPATLDSCFQSAFLSYASPGDKALWTSFLPSTIERVQFNLATNHQVPETGQDDMLSVDTYTTSVKNATPESKATVTVDIGVFNGSGETEIRVDGLVVSALSNIQPKDDYELYLHTVMDIDPTDEIVQSDFKLSATYDPMLVESCSRVASYFLRDTLGVHAAQPHPDISAMTMGYSSIPGLDLTVKSWATDTKENIDEFIQNSKHRVYLDRVRTLGENDPFDLARNLPSIVDEAHYLVHFHSHVGRVVKQIVHRYARMNILGLTTFDNELIRHVLTATSGLSFRQFTIGTETEMNIKDLVRSMGSAGNALQQVVVDFNEKIGSQLGVEQLQDVVILSTSLLENRHAMSILKNIRDAMRPEAFLVLVHTAGTSHKDHKQHREEPGEVSSPPEWPDILDSCGFSRIAKNSDQFHHGSFVLVRQLTSTELQLKRAPLQSVRDIVTRDLLLVGGIGQEVKDLSIGLKKSLSPFCHNVFSRDSFETLEGTDLESCTAAIVLADLDSPLISHMTEDRLAQLRTLFRPNMTVLWLTHGSRDENPEHAATFGFTRTIAAEIPNLRLQLLDLEHIGSSEHIIAESFIRLLVAKEDEVLSLWTQEAEIYMENGHRMIPRVLPLKEWNDRVNVMRRVVSKPLNTLHQAVELVPRRASDGSPRYQTKANGLDIQATSSDLVLIQVDYSSINPVKVHKDLSAHVCLGRIMSTGARVVAFSDNSASYISCPPSQVFSLSECAMSGLHTIHLIMRYMVAIIVMINPDEAFAAYVTELARKSGGTAVSYTTTQGAAFATFLHPRTTTHEIKRVIPVLGGIVFDFLPENDEFSQTIRQSISENCKYFSLTSPPGSQNSLHRVGSSACGTGLQDDVLKATQEISQSPQSAGCFQTISLLDLQSDLATGAPFQVIDWRTARNATELVKYHCEEQLLSPNKTYVLVGLTRDLGQSICRLFVRHGARNIVLTSRNPNTVLKWTEELLITHGAKVKIEKADVTKYEDVLALKEKLSQTMPPVGGVINGAMVLDDRVFAQMTTEIWNRVLLPKALGSQNLDRVFSEPDLEFFIMTSSFAAIGGHPGQSNYAAANMYMNGLAANRRKRGLAGSALNIGVIYGMGFLHREKDHLYAGLEREGYPPISERDIHHMFLEAIVAGRAGVPDQPVDITTGLNRFKPGEENPLHWHLDPRFCHFTVRDDGDDDAAARGTKEIEKSLKVKLASMTEVDEMAAAILPALSLRLENLVGVSAASISSNESMVALGVDSLVAVEIRNWIWKTVGGDFPVMKILGTGSIYQLCRELSEQLLADRDTVKEVQV